MKERLFFIFLLFAQHFEGAWERDRSVRATKVDYAKGYRDGYRIAVFELDQPARGCFYPIPAGLARYLRHFDPDARYKF